MEERATLTLNSEEIKNILFKHYFGDYFDNVKEKIIETLIMDYKIVNENQFGKIRKNIYFIIKYEKQLATLDKSITREIIIDLKELTNIINDKISNEGYEIATLRENIMYGTKDNSKDKLNFITYNLKKKEKVKTKKRGWKKNV